MCEERGRHAWVFGTTRETHSLKILPVVLVAVLLLLMFEKVDEPDVRHALERFFDSPIRLFLQTFVQVFERKYGEAHQAEVVGR